MKIAMGLLLFLGLNTHLWAECKTVSAAEFAKISQGRKRIVFFASWCKSCEEHLTSDYAKDSIFVSGFDDEGTADAVLKKFLGAKASETPCVIDRDERLGKLYKLKFLPYVVAL